MGEACIFLFVEGRVIILGKQWRVFNCSMPQLYSFVLTFSWKRFNKFIESVMLMSFMGAEHRVQQSCLRPLFSARPVRPMCQFDHSYSSEVLKAVYMEPLAQKSTAFGLLYEQDTSFVTFTIILATDATSDVGFGRCKNDCSTDILSLKIYLKCWEESCFFYFKLKGQPSSLPTIIISRSVWHINHQIYCKCKP